MASTPTNEFGAGLIALTWSVLAYLMFLMLAVQVAMDFYTASIVGAVGHDAVRQAAFAGGSPDARADAEQWLRARIGSSVNLESVRWDTTDGVVSLNLAVRPPTMLIGAPGLPTSRRFERRFEVRTETPQFARSR
ncbi:hypothetical protein [Candidatus Poriferisodalis sp.]|uniref:hypothetical protein n=1 Tax=Candidatus Poriferisodalis sp. TaxID=3101277 RepID=UPI003D10E798